MFKAYIQRKLERSVRRYFKVHPDVKLVVVTGSVGKTTTKTMIATLLSQQLRVRMENTNHNTHMSAPLGILGIEYPEKIRNVGAWWRVFRACRQRIRQPSDVDIIIQELGTDHIGDIARFGTYLRPDIAVVTAVTPEHMEFFQTIENVAKEELEAANFSKLALINRDDIDGRFADLITNGTLDTYGTTNAAEYRFEINDFRLEKGYEGVVLAPELKQPLSATVNVVGEHSLRPVMAAVAVAIKCGLSPAMIQQGLGQVQAVAGRMNVLRGVNDTMIIDDTYNSSPAAVSSALQALYGLQSPQRIAILGSMNELGDSAEAEHKALGELCDPSLLSWVVTVGKDAENWLAPTARARGCQVKSFRNPIDAGSFVHSILEKNAIILAKGSQGGIFCEEAVKVLLHETHENDELVRQSPAWMRAKASYLQKL